METLKAAEQARQEELEYRQKVQQNQRQDEQRTAKRRKKRERQKEAKRRRQNLEKAGVLFSSEDDTAETNTNSQTNDEQSVEEDDEFDVPTAPPKALANEAEKPSTFANDGSFLEMMKRQMAEGRKVGTEKSNDAITTKSAEDTPKKDWLKVAIFDHLDPTNYYQNRYFWQQHGKLLDKKLDTSIY